MMTGRDEEKYKAFVEDDLKNNKGLIVNQYAEIEQLMTADHTKMDGFMKSYLNNILDYAVENSIFYKDYLDYKSLSDFPIVNKNILREHYDEIEVKRYKFRKDSEVKSTSGSTGMPFSITMDRRKHCRYIADLKWFAAVAGCVSHERMVYLHNAHHAYEKSMEIQDRDNFYNLGYTYCDDASIEELFDQVERLQPYGLIAYTSLFNAMADYILLRNPKRYSIPLKFIAVTSEFLNERTRKAIEGYFGCPVYSRYGAEEMGVMAQEDSSGNGFRFNEASFYLEVLQMDSDQPVKNGETGRIVITDLFSRAFPLIRYDTGDIGIKNVLEDGTVYLSQIWGRALDSIYTTDGRIVPGGEATDFLEAIVDIKQFQLIQESRKEYHWIINTDNHSYESLIVKETRKMLGEDADVDIEYVSEIPSLKSGKRLKTICKIKVE